MGSESINSLGVVAGVIAGIIGSASVIAGAVYGFYRWAAPHATRHVTAYRAAMGIGDKWGPDAGALIRKLIQDLSRDSSQVSLRIDMLARHLNLGVYVCETDGRMSYVNDALSEMFGLDSTEMLRHGWLSAVDDRRQAFEDLRFSLANAIPYEGAYVVVNQRTGERQCCATRAYPVVSDGVVTCYVGYVEPVDGESGRCPVSRRMIASCPMTNGTCPVKCKDGAGVAGVGTSGSGTRPPRGSAGTRAVGGESVSPAGVVGGEFVGGATG